MLPAGDPWKPRLAAPVPAPVSEAEPPADLLCPVAGELFADPVFTADGHSYSRAPIERWFAERRWRGLPPTSPLTGAALTSAALVPNHDLRARVAAWAERNRVVQGAPCTPSPVCGTTGTKHVPPSTGCDWWAPGRAWPRSRAEPMQLDMPQPTAPDKCALFPRPAMASSILRPPFVSSIHARAANFGVRPGANLCAGPGANFCVGPGANLCLAPGANFWLGPGSAVCVVVVQPLLPLPAPVPKLLRPPA